MTGAAWKYSNFVTINTWLYGSGAQDEELQSLGYRAEKVQSGIVNVGKILDRIWQSVDSDSFSHQVPPGIVQWSNTMPFTKFTKCAAVPSSTVLPVPTPKIAPPLGTESDKAKKPKKKFNPYEDDGMKGVRMSSRDPSDTD